MQRLPLWNCAAVYVQVLTSEMLQQLEHNLPLAYTSHDLVDCSSCMHVYTSLLCSEKLQVCRSSFQDMATKLLGTSSLKHGINAAVRQNLQSVFIWQTVLGLVTNQTMTPSLLELNQQLSGPAAICVSLKFFCTLASYENIWRITALAVLTRYHTASKECIFGTIPLINPNAWAITWLRAYSKVIGSTIIIVMVVIIWVRAGTRNAASHASAILVLGHLCTSVLSYSFVGKMVVNLLLLHSCSCRIVSLLSTSWSFYTCMRNLHCYSSMCTPETNIDINSTFCVQRSPKLTMELVQSCRAMLPALMADLEAAAANGENLYSALTGVVLVQAVECVMQTRDLMSSVWADELTSFVHDHGAQSNLAPLLTLLTCQK